MGIATAAEVIADASVPAATARELIIEQKKTRTVPYSLVFISNTDLSHPLQPLELYNILL